MLLNTSKYKCKRKLFEHIGELPDVELPDGELPDVESSREDCSRVLSHAHNSNRSEISTS